MKTTMMIKSMVMVAMMSVSTMMSAKTANKPVVKNDKHMTEVVTTNGHGHMTGTAAPGQMMAASTTGHGHMMATPAPAKPAASAYVCKCHDCKKHERMMAEHPRKADKHYECKCHECKSHKPAPQGHGHR